MTGSWLDVLLVVMLVTSITLGFHHGLLKQGFLLVAMYIATVLAAQYYSYVSSILLRSFPSAAPVIADSIAFALLATAFTVGLTWIIWRSFKGTKLPSALILDNMGGAILGSVIGLFAISLTLMLVRYAVQVPWPDGSTVKFALSTGLSGSLLQDVFSTPMPIVQALLHPLVPAGLPFMPTG